MTDSTKKTTTPKEKTFTAIQPVQDLEQFRNQHKTFRSLVKSDMKEGIDYGLIPGTKKKSLWQAGAEKLANFFSLTSSFKLIKEIEKLNDPTSPNFVYYKYKCILTHFETGKVVGEAERSCNSQETSKIKTGKSIYDLINTCQAVAQKRAFVAAVRTATMASDFFVSDISESNGSAPATANSQPDPIRKNQMAKLHAVATPRGFNEERLHKAIFVMFKKKSRTELTGAEMADLTERLLSEFKIVGADNEPERINAKDPGDEGFASSQPVPPEEVEEAEEVKPIKLKMCAQCKKKPAREDGFCSDECQDKYYPPKETLAEKLKKRNEIRQSKNKKLQLIKLKCGIEVWVDWNSKEKCECGNEIWWAITDKNKKPMPIELVGLAEWDTHFANCPLAEEKRKNGKSER